YGFRAPSLRSGPGMTLFHYSEYGLLEQVLDHDLPALRLAGQEACEAGIVLVGHGSGQRFHIRLHRRRLEDLGDLGRELLDHRRRRARRREQPDETPDAPEAGHALLSDGWNLRRGRRAPGLAHAERAQAAGSDVRIG